MSYHFMLGVCPLPINPSALNIKTPSLNKTVTLIDHAEINIPKGEGLREISFDFLLPTFQKYPFETYRLGNYTAATIILYLRLWKNMKIPLPFIVVRMSPGGKFLYFTSIKCVIEDLSFDEDAKEHGFDTMCSITLKEYVDYGTKRVKLKDTQNGTQQASTTDSRSTADRSRSSTVQPREGETVSTAYEREGYSMDGTPGVDEGSSLFPDDGLVPESEYPTGVDDCLTDNSGTEFMPGSTQTPTSYYTDGGVGTYRNPTSILGVSTEGEVSDLSHFKM